MEPQFTLISIVLLVVLFIPGFFFKRFYFQGNFARQFGSGILDQAEYLGDIKFLNAIC